MCFFFFSPSRNLLFSFPPAVRRITGEGRTRDRLNTERRYGGSKTQPSPPWKIQSFSLTRSALGSGKVSEGCSTRRSIFHILFCATRRLTASAGDKYVQCPERTNDRASERTSGRTSPPAGVCATLFHATPCGPPSPSNKEHRALVASSASGVNILSTLFFHRTSRFIYLSHLRPSPTFPVFSLFSLVLLLAEKPRR